MCLPTVLQSRSGAGFPLECGGRLRMGLLDDRESSPASFSGGDPRARLAEEPVDQASHLWRHAARSWSPIGETNAILRYDLGLGPYLSGTTLLRRRRPADPRTP